MHEHINRMVEKVSQQLDQRNADMVVLPELSTIEYSRETFELMPELAEDLQGQTVETMQGLATTTKSAVVFGMPRVRAGQYFISQVVIDAEGKIAGCYDKLHICQYGASMEKEFFQRRGKSLCV